MSNLDVKALVKGIVKRTELPKLSDNVLDATKMFLINAIIRKYHKDLIGKKINVPQFEQIIDSCIKYLKDRKGDIKVDWNDGSPVISYRKGANK